MLPNLLDDVLADLYTGSLLTVTVPFTAFSMDGVAVGAGVGVAVSLVLRSRALILQ